MKHSSEIPEPYVQAGPVAIGTGHPLAIIAGPCVIEDPDTVLKIAAELETVRSRLSLPLIFKASFDKANRSSVDSFRGPGIEQGLEILAAVKAATGLPVLTDIHLPEQASRAADIVDIIQIPAFLCRQTDLLIAAGKTGKPVNIKKGQFVAPRNMKQAVDKVRSTGNTAVMLTERGTSFGYNNLVVDMRGLALMKDIGVPVVFDATHSVQIPGGLGGSSGGERRFVPLLARAAVSAGVDAVFMEVHHQPDKALCDGQNSWPLADFEKLITELLALHAAAKQYQE
jgi:2-dehydro-3-deoxyphosphooctonate aldolase (KDO 8-P synthase)